jgi:aryl-alcohol dehydrogenase-like predicted oxidoreductase
MNSSNGFFRAGIPRQGKREKKGMDRRTFVKGTVAGTIVGGLSVGLGGCSDSLLNELTQVATIPKRRLGKTGAVVTIIGLGGWHIGAMQDENAAITMIHHALDLGVNFLDTAWAYQMGQSEIRLGKALHGKRDKVFLMTKTAARDKTGARAQLEESLGRLQTDYLDLWQFHSLNSFADVETIWGPDGAMEAAVEAKQEGKVRHIGFTGHRDPQVHLKAITEHHDSIETVQMPLSVVDPHYGSFEKPVLPVALEHGLGVIAMKTMAFGGIAEDRIATAAECHNYVWTLPVSTLVAGMNTFEELEDNVQQAIQFTPLSEAEIANLLARTRPHAGPQLEAYKTDAPFSEWRRYPKEPVL